MPEWNVASENVVSENVVLKKQPTQSILPVQGRFKTYRFNELL